MTNDHHMTTYNFKGTIPPDQLNNLCHSTHTRSEKPATINGIWIPEQSVLAGFTAEEAVSGKYRTTITVHVPNLACCCLECLDPQPPKTDAGSPLVMDVYHTSDWPSLCEGLYYISPNSKGSL